MPAAFASWMAARPTLLAPPQIRSGVDVSGDSSGATDVEVWRRTDAGRASWLKRESAAV
jgi:hypothetical protein